MPGADEVFDLAADFAKSASEVVVAVRETFDASGKRVAQEWADGVRASAPKHLPHLPDAITHESKFTLGGVTVEFGPEAGSRQGRLGKGEELGSRNQPPHLNGLKAMAAEESKLLKAAGDRISVVLP